MNGQLITYTDTELAEQMAESNELRFERGYFATTKNAASPAVLTYMWICAICASLLCFFQSVIVALPCLAIFFVSGLQIQALQARGVAVQTIIVKTKHVGRAWIIPSFIFAEVGMVLYMFSHFKTEGWEPFAVLIIAVVASTLYRFVGLQK